LDNLIARVQPLYVSVKMFVRVFQAPDPHKMRKYGVQDAFYLESDPAICLAREAQTGAILNLKEIVLGLEETSNKSGYAKAVCRGLQRLREASAFWSGACRIAPDLRQ
jgi:hypothetical protein